VSNEETRQEGARAIRLGRRLRTLHRCNRMFFHAKSEQELLQSICQILVSGDELRLAWVGYCEDDADKTVRPVARAGHAVDFLKQVRISWGGVERGQDPAGIAVRTGAACRINDIQAHPTLSPWRSAAVAHAFDSCVAVPLVAHSHQTGAIDLRGALVLYTAEKGALDESAVEFYAELATCLSHAVTALRGNLAGDLAHDVTALRAAEERRRAEDALRKARVELERVMQMTAMGEMAASIAHEINQPLGAIVSNGNAGLRWLAIAPPDLEEARAALKRIVADGHRASEVISGIRSMFKKEGQLTGPQDMSELVREVLTLVRGEVAGQGISVRTELSSELPQISVSRVQLQQVIANLVMNAVDAMSTVANRARVLRVKTGVNESMSLLITVEDTGIGIDPNDFDRIFDPFYTTKSHGMGMGLSICRSIIEIHGGRLTVSPARPHGSVFQVSLPTAGVGPCR
jgi:C4-dicarboxylate-specific signal transduction histidine kinase